MTAIPLVLYIITTWQQLLYSLSIDSPFNSFSLVYCFLYSFDPCLIASSWSLLLVPVWLHRPGLYFWSLSDCIVPVFTFDPCLIASFRSLLLIPVWLHRPGLYSFDPCLIASSRSLLLVPVWLHRSGLYFWSLFVSLLHGRIASTYHPLGLASPQPSIVSV